LFLDERKRGSDLSQKLKVCVVENQFEEGGVFVGKPLIKLLLIDLPLFAPFNEEHHDGKRKREGFDAVKRNFANFQQSHEAIFAR